MEKIHGPIGLTVIFASKFPLTYRYVFKLIRITSILTLVYGVLYLSILYSYIILVLVFLMN
jgi:hypothetical protein